MNQDFNQFYPAKSEYDDFIKRVQEIEKMDINKRSKYCMEIYSLYKQGLPYQNRHIALKYFYKVMPLKGRIEMNQEEEERAGIFIMDSILDSEINKYIRLNDPEDLYDICQVRGKLFTVIFIDVDTGKIQQNLKENWLEVYEAAEEFYKSEPCIPIEFLEDYSRAISICGYPKQKARIYELAAQSLNYSTNINYIKVNYLTVKDYELLRAYKKETLNPSDVEKLIMLEHLEKEVEAEFGGVARYTKNIVGKAFTMITKEGRERRAAQKEYQRDWIYRIRRTAGSGESYIRGYAEYLYAMVYMGTDDMKKAIKALEKAFELNFDEDIALAGLFNIHNLLKHNSEAQKYAQLYLDDIGYTKVDDIKESDTLYQYYLTLKKNGKEPFSAERIWKRIAEENKDKKNELIEELKPKVEEFREEDKERRILNGIKIIDSILLPDSVEGGCQQAGDYDKVILQTPKDDFLNNSLEELELFINAGAESLIKMYQGKIGLMELLNYYEKLIENRRTEFLDELEDNMEEYPNFAGCIPLVKKNVTKLISLGKQAEAEIIIKHTISIREGLKSSLLYDALKPYLEILNDPLQKIKKIEILKLSKPLLQDSEHNIATKDMIDTYIDVINNEKSPGKKDKYLKDAEKGGLKDARLDELRKGVDDLLYKRKKLIQKILFVGVGVIIIVILILLLTK